MTIHQRIDLAGNPQHVIQRGNNRASCFFAEANYVASLHWLHESAQHCGVAIRAKRAKKSVTMNQHLLSSIADQLNNGGLNYSVFLQSYTVPINVQGVAKEYIRNALGSGAIVENIQAVTGTEVLEKIDAAISYAGDASAGPASATLKSPAFAALRAELLSEIKATIAEAKLVEQFWLSKGHPAYPVFWDFAFLFTLPKEVVIFIGSSSD